MKAKKGIIALSVILLLVLGWFWFVKKSDNSTEKGYIAEKANPSDSPVHFVTNRAEDSVNQRGDTTIQRKGDSTSTQRKGAASIVSSRAAIMQQAKSSFQESYVNKKYNNSRSVRGNQNSIIQGGGSSYRLMEFSRGIGALLAMYEAMDDEQYLVEALDLSEKIIATAKKGRNIEKNPELFKDDYLGWVNQNPKSNKNGGAHLQEIPLFESYLFRYLAKMAYIIEASPEFQSQPDLLERGRKIRQFVGKNGWEKWYTRGETKSPGCYPYLFRNRTHMTSHWAMTALYLRELSANTDEKSQYTEFLALYDNQLKANFKRTPNDAYTWNMTWDNPWPYKTRCNRAPQKPIIQDVSHGNHVVTYIVDAHSLSKSVWTDTDIQRLVNTVKYLIYDESKNRFNSDLNKGFAPRMANGILMSDGFVKLARYDRGLVDIFERVREGHENSSFSLDEPQFVAELTLAKKNSIER